MVIDPPGVGSGVGPDSDTIASGHARPNPLPVSRPAGGMSFACFWSAARNSRSASGLPTFPDASNHDAATPATIGVAIEVPLNVA